MAVHSVQCLNNVSFATGKFTGRSKPRITQSTALRQQNRFDALTTFNRREALPLSSFGGSRMQAITSGMSTFYGGPSLQQLSQHIGRPRFNALARLASTALRSSFEARGSTAAAVRAAVGSVASPVAPGRRQPVQLQPAIPVSTSLFSSFTGDLSSCCALARV